MPALSDLAAHVAAALRGAIAAHPHQDAGAARDMLAVAESIAARGGLDVDDLRQRQLSAGAGAALLVRVLPFGSGKDEEIRVVDSDKSMGIASGERSCQAFGYGKRAYRTMRDVPQRARHRVDKES